MSVTVIPAGHRAPHVLTDFMFTRRCKACEGKRSEDYFDGPTMRSYREGIWGEGSMRRMAREIDVPPSRLSRMERNALEWNEDIARRYLTALGIL